MKDQGAHEYMQIYCMNPSRRRRGEIPGGAAASYSYRYKEVQGLIKLWPQVTTCVWGYCMLSQQYV
jgi:hypothetical protein